MFDLTKQEKAILLFLSFSFVCGLGINAYKNLRPDLNLSVQPYKMELARKEADTFIQQHSQININSLKIKELARLSGIGKTLAARIIEYHKMHGPFQSKEELMQVKGIGEKKFNKIKDSIILE